jgi:pyridoxamine 5'-phosphate oxidase
MSPSFGFASGRAREPMSQTTHLAPRLAAGKGGGSRAARSPGVGKAERGGVYWPVRRPRDIIRPCLLPTRSVIALNVVNLVDFTEATDPVALFQLWFEEAIRSEINDPEAMALATVDAAGMPDARMVLCKGADARGLVFYTNNESAKGRELAGQPNAAALFYWKSLRRQARFRGAVTELTGAESDAYFASRPRGSQIGAWASQQSRPLASRAALEEAVERYERRFGSGEIPRPDYWRGYRLAPNEIEFWRDRPSRLHDRLLFKRETTETKWEKRLLYP